MTNQSEKEKAIRKGLRIKEVHYKDGSVLFYPQFKFLWLWWGFDDDYNTPFTYRKYPTFDKAKKFIDTYIEECLRKKKVIYHYV